MSTQRHNTFQKIQANHWDSILLLTFSGAEDLPKVIGRDEPTKLQQEAKLYKKPEIISCVLDLCDQKTFHDFFFRRWRWC